MLILFNSAFVNVISQKENNFSSELKYALIEASRLKVLGNFDEAIKVYRSCVKSYPSCAAAWFEIGSLYASAQMDELAEENLKKAYVLDKENYWYAFYYSELLSINKKFQESNVVIKKMIKDFPKEEIILIFKTADNYDNMGKYQKALKLFEHIEKNLGFSEMISIRKIDILKKTGKSRKLEKEFENTFKIYPENIALNIVYAEYLVQKGLTKEAIEKYEDILTMDEDNIYAISNLSELYDKIGEKDLAKQFLVKSIQSEEISIRRKLQILSFLVHEDTGISEDTKYIDEIISILNEKENNNFEFLIVVYDYYNKEERLDEAFDIIKKLTELRKEDYIIWAQALFNALQIQKYDELIELGKEALTIFPNKDDLRTLIALAYYNTSDYNEAYDILKEAGDNYDEAGLKMQSKILLAELSYKLGNVEESFEYFEILLKEVPEEESIVIKNNYSYYMALEKVNLNRAKSLSYETILKDPENSTFLDTYAWVLYQLGEYKEAEVYIRKAVSYSKEINDEILGHMKEILIRNGKNEEAELIQLDLLNIE